MTLRLRCRVGSAHRLRGTPYVDVTYLVIRNPIPVNRGSAHLAIGVRRTRRKQVVFTSAHS